MSLVYIYVNSTAYSLEHYWYMYGPFKYVLFITQTNFPDTYFEKGFIFLQVLNFLPYFTYRHEITHMVLQVKLYPIMDGTNNEKFCVERSTIYMYTCTDRHDFYHIYLQVGTIEKGGISTCIVKNIIFKLLFNTNTYTVYTGSKTEENHFRLHFHNNIITGTFIHFYKLIIFLSIPNKIRF